MFEEVTGPRGCSKVILLLAELLGLMGVFKIN